MTAEDENTLAEIQNIKRAEREIVELYAKHSDGAVGYQHFFLFGIARRALAQATAFRQMVESKNSIVALSLSRLQLDTVMRLYALFWVADPEQFASDVFHGSNINKLKDADGKFMRDNYLYNRLAKTNPWIPSVYSETSGYIHFSNRHIRAALRLSTDDTSQQTKLRKGHLLIGGHDVDRPIGYYGEVVRAFCHVTMMIPVAVEDWFGRMEKSSAPASVGKVDLSKLIYLADIEPD